MKFSGVILYVPDVRKTLAFYERAFGLKQRFLSDDASFGDVHTGSLLLGFASVEMSRKNWKGGVHVSDPKGAPPAFEIGIETDDVAGVVKRAADAGATVLAPPETKPWGQTVAFLKDPDGHVVEVATPWAP
jgi:catechol 2,3-dioxygenase-like lactoylglutathione lyase family enzyme